MTGPDRAALGREGEELACRYLLEHGYTITERNWRTRAGELDIIASSEGFTVFVEVKTRRGTAFGEPEEAVTTRKTRRIRALASEYLAGGAHPGGVRFDVISILLDGDCELVELRHITDAF